ncbi:8-amino-7-oxononanoate synthase-like [Quercus lobata]|uniref:8-amino-7-oxononanoate synthase-like n=1 Tax=Quercus lobata TaxID=97700 RepID=UPI0012469F37|nr:8-amino-7-oxononanoate synthase-like [Quercus lobata]
MSSWDNLVEEALAKLESLKHLLPIRTIHLSNPNDQQQIRIENHETTQSSSLSQQGKASFQVFNEIQPWDLCAVEVQVAEVAFQRLIHFLPSTGEETFSSDKVNDNEEETHLQQFKKLLLFCGNDYLGLTSHPTIKRAAVKAAQEHGMGPRGSALICGYTNYHRQLESSLADLQKKEDCLLCPTGFAANMALMVTIGSIASLLAVGRKPSEEERIAIFSDAQNHASIVDGIYLAERQQSVEVFVYRHCDMSHLNALLLKCKLKRKAVVTDSLFSMDGDFAPMVEIAKLRKKHQFLFVIDDAHGTLVCGKNGGGVTEEFNCEGDVDICIGSLSKATGCIGGFIACSKSWKQLIQSRGRSFIFSTTMPIPIAAAAHASVIVAKKETWRRREIWKRVQDFRALTGIPIKSPIISFIVGSEEKALQASRHLLTSGFYVSPVRPPAVPPNSCRLRVTLSAVHTTDDLKKLTTTLSQCIAFRDIGIQNSNKCAKL